MPALEFVLKARDQATKTLDKVSGRVKMATKSFDRVFKSLVNFRNLVVVSAIVGIGTSFIKAASSIEVFRKQLEMVTGSATQADKALAAIREFARTSPLETEDVVQSYVRLRAVGMDPTMRQMKTLGGVAVLMNRELTDVLDSFIGLNKRTLRQLGVEIDRTGQKAVIASGDIRREVSKDSASIREALLEVWGERFPDAITKAADTANAKLAVVKSQVFELQAEIGEKFLPVYKMWLDGVNSIFDSVRKKTIRLRKDIARLDKQIDDLLERKYLRETGKGGFRIWLHKLGVSDKQLDAMIELAHKNLEKAQRDLDDEIEKGKGGLGGTGALGAGGLENGGKGPTAAQQARNAAELEKYGAVLTDIQRIAVKKQEKLNQEWVKQQEEARKTRLEWEKNFKESAQKALDEYVENEEKRTKIAQEEAEKRREARQAELDHYYQVNASLVRSTISTASAIASTVKTSAKKRQNVLVALAVAEGAASAVTAAKAGWDTGVTYWDKAALAAAGAIEAIAISAAQIATIKSQSFASGGVTQGGPAMLHPNEVILNPKQQANLLFGLASGQGSINGQINGGVTVVVQGNADETTIRKIEEALPDAMQRAFRSGTMRDTLVDVQGAFA